MSAKDELEEAAVTVGTYSGDTYSGKRVVPLSTAIEIVAKVERKLAKADECIVAFERATGGLPNAERMQQQVATLERRLERIPGIGYFTTAINADTWEEVLPKINELQEQVATLTAEKERLTKIVEQGTPSRQDYFTAVKNRDGMMGKVVALTAENERLTRLHSADLIMLDSPCENHVNMDIGGVCGGCLIVERARDAEQRVDTLTAALEQARERLQVATAMAVENRDLQDVILDALAALNEPQGKAVLSGEGKGE